MGGAVRMYGPLRRPRRPARQAAAAHERHEGHGDASHPSPFFLLIFQVAAAVTPDLVIFVMDGSIGQAAFDQAAAFKGAVEVGAVILTKMDGHARGGGALAAVAATSAPIAFIGTGEHLDELERFDPKSFVGRLLGRGDWKGFVDRIADAVPPGGEAGMEAVLAQIQSGKFTLRLMYDQFKALQRMGPLGQVMGMIPGLSAMMGAAGGEGGADKASALKMRRSMTIMDSMTDEVCFLLNLGRFYARYF